MVGEKLPKVLMEHVVRRYLDAGLLDEQPIPVVSEDGSVWTLARVRAPCRLLCRLGHVPSQVDLQEGEIVRYEFLTFEEGRKR